MLCRLRMLLSVSITPYSNNTDVLFLCSPPHNGGVLSRYVVSEKKTIYTIPKKEYINYMD